MFTDTNLFFQCGEISSLPWSDLGDFTEIELIVVRPVQKEIDRRKGEINTRLGKRARKAHSLFRKVIENQLEPIVLRARSPQVRLSLQIALRPNPHLAMSLDYQEADDALVGIASGFAADHPGLDVAVLTHDGGVMASAVAARVPHFAVPDSWLSPPEETKNEKELKVAQAEIQRLRNAEPVFKLECLDTDGEPVVQAVLESADADVLSNQEVQRLMERAKARFPKQTSFENPPPSPPANKLRTWGLETLRGAQVPPSDKQIDDYYKEYQSWESALEKNLRLIHNHVQSVSSKLTIGFSAKNIGTRPAEDVLVTITGRGNFGIDRPSVEKPTSESPILPNPPPAPKWYEMRLDQFLRQVTLGGTSIRDSLAYSPLPPLQRHDPEAFYYKPRATSEDLVLTCDLWRHGRPMEEFNAVVKLPGTRDGSGTVEFRIHAKNLSDSVALIIPIRVRVTKPKTYEYATMIIDQLEPGNAW